MNPDLEFFDCNARIGRPTVYRQGDPIEKADVMAQMDYAGVARALVYHSLAEEWSPQDGNDALLAEIEEDSRLFPCFVGLPRATRELSDAHELASRVRALNGAVRIFPTKHKFSLRQWTVSTSFEALATQRVPLLINIDETSWEDLAHVLSAHENLPVILLGTYYRYNRFLYPLWERHNNLYLETTTYQTFGAIEEVCERFGPERLVFGTNLPHLEVGGAISAIVYADIPDEAKAKIASGNLATLLGLPG